MSLYDDALSGLVLNSGARPDGNPIDIVLVTPGGILVGYGKWWRVEADVPLEFLSGRLVKQGSGWKLTGRLDGADLYLTAPEEADEVKVLEEMVTARRLYKDRYLAVLATVAEKLNPIEALSMKEWTVLVTALLPVDLAALLVAPPRLVGRVLLEEDGMSVAILLLDASGDYAVFGSPDDWLESIGSEWANNPADLPAFLQWVKTKTPYGPRSITRIDSLTAGGPLVAIAPHFHLTTL